MRENKFWLLKSEPDNYAYADLVRDGATVWDGVSNNAALLHLRAMQPGDLAPIIIPAMSANADRAGRNHQRAICRPARQRSQAGGGGCATAAAGWRAQ